MERSAETAGNQTLRVLFIDDSPADLKLLQVTLRNAGYKLECDAVDSLPAFEEQLSRRCHEIILSDYNLGNWTALDALGVVKRAALDTPVIVVSGSLGDEAAAEVIKQGAVDYILKDRLARLPNAVHHALEQKLLRARQVEAQKQLRESEQRFRLLVETVRDYAIFMLDESGNVATWNAGAERLKGYSAGEILGQPFSIFYPETERRAGTLERALATARQHGKWHDEGWRIRKDGALFWADVVITAVTNDSGELIGYSTITRDLTERKQASDRIELQVQRLRSLRAIDIAITSSLDLRVSLDVVLDQVTTQLGVHAADILLLNSEEQSLEFSAGRGFRSSRNARSSITRPDDPARRVVLERNVWQLSSPLDNAHFENEAALQHEDFRWYLAAPLIAKGQVNGVLEVWHREPLDPHSEWFEFLEALAGQAAIAVDNSTLYRQLQESHADLLFAYDTTLEGWVKALDMRDKETEGHTRRVTEITMRLAHAFRLPKEEVVHIRRGALLHDIGKMAIPDSILHKPGPLNDAEWQIMRLHTVYAYNWISPIPYLRPAIDIPYCHHEKWDGTGYPRGLRGEEIPLAARLFALADVWDALRSDRPYRKGWPVDVVTQYVQERAGTHFDRRVVPVFLNGIGEWESKRDSRSVPVKV